MEILFVRHGEPTYDNAQQHSLVSYLGELTPAGIQQAKRAASNKALKEAQIIISSPFTRALQTAAIISAENLVPIVVESGLHEWLADKSHLYTLDKKYCNASYQEFLDHNGVHDEHCLYNWESVEEIATRVYPVIHKYLNLGYSKIVVVAHAMVIRTFGYKEQEMPYCNIYQTDFTADTQFEGFVPWNG